MRTWGVRRDEARAAADDATLARLQVGQARWPVAKRIAAIAFVRLVEINLVITGLTFTLSEDLDDQFEYLILYDLLALAYLGIGALVMRRRALRKDEDAPPDPALVDQVRRSPPMSRLLAVGRFAEERFAFLLTWMASLTGVFAAVVVVTNRDGSDLSQLIQVTGILAVGIAWCLLQAGYARFYQQLYRRPGARGGGFDFPSCPHPGPVEFTYLAFTVGTTFALSDVTITKRSLRWHLTVHSVIAFAYNAAVLAIVVGAVVS